MNEWSLDWYTTYVNPCADCAVAGSPLSARVVRGGNYNGPRASLLPTNRRGIGPSSRYNDIGFRCARTP
jgi:formylglycine-generating enzyme required for sulfatase activity